MYFRLDPLDEYIYSYVSILFSACIPFKQTEIETKMTKGYEKMQHRFQLFDGCSWSVSILIRLT